MTGKVTQTEPEETVLPSAAWYSLGVNAQCLGPEEISCALHPPEGAEAVVAPPDMGGVVGDRSYSKDFGLGPCFRPSPVQEHPRRSALCRGCGGGGGGGGRRRGGRTRRTVGEVSSFGGWCRGLTVDGRASQCHTAPLCLNLCQSGGLRSPLSRSAAGVKEFIFVAAGEDLGEELLPPELGQDLRPHCYHCRRRRRHHRLCYCGDLPETRPGTELRWPEGLPLPTDIWNQVTDGSLPSCPRLSCSPLRAPVSSLPWESWELSEVLSPEPQEEEEEEESEGEEVKPPEPGYLPGRKGATRGSRLWGPQPHLAPVPSTRG
nr:uncharacterized protein LOC107033789 [Vicugna pacos]